MSPASRNLDIGYIVPIGYQCVNCHMISDVKMEDFRRRSSLVVGGHMAETPATITYVRIVNRETVRIALTLAALSGFPAKVADIQNSYIPAHVTEKIWKVLGPEFGEDYGRKAIVVHALYGLKSARDAFWNLLDDCMHHFGLLPCPADLYLFMKPMVRYDDGFNYYDMMFIHYYAESVLRRIYKYFNLNPISVGDPDIYMGYKLKKMRLENGVWEWANSPATYAKEPGGKVEKYLDELADAHWKFPKKKAKNSYICDYASEMDKTPDLDQVLSSWFHSMIGMIS